MSWKTRKVDGKHFKTNKSSYRPPKDKKLRNTIKFDTYDNALDASIKLQKMFEQAKTREEKLKIKRATVSASNRLKGILKNGNLNHQEKMNIMLIQGCYGVAQKKMKLPKDEKRSEISFDSRGKRVKAPIVKDYGNHKIVERKMLNGDPVYYVLEKSKSDNKKGFIVIAPRVMNLERAIDFVKRKKKTEIDKANNYFDLGMKVKGEGHRVGIIEELNRNELGEYIANIAVCHPITDEIYQRRRMHIPVTELKKVLGVAGDPESYKSRYTVTVQSPFEKGLRFEEGTRTSKIKPPKVIGQKYYITAKGKKKRAKEALEYPQLDNQHVSILDDLQVKGVRTPKQIAEYEMDHGFLWGYVDSNAKKIEEKLKWLEHHGYVRKGKR